MANIVLANISCTRVLQIREPRGRLRYIEEGETVLVAGMGG